VKEVPGSDATAAHPPKVPQLPLVSVAEERSTTWPAAAMPAVASVPSANESATDAAVRYPSA
jgi:hypothetical protein